MKVNASAGAVDDRPRRLPGRRARFALALAATAAFVALAYRPLFLGNLGVVDPGLVYRSAQPRANLHGLIRDHRIATVLNLRGGSAADDWYADEVRATRELGVDFYDLPMGATRRPGRQELLALVDLFERCAYPILIHCKSGSDRTGLASAVYRMVRRGVPPEQALEEFTLRHGHVPLFGPEKLHEPFREYAAWLSARGLDHSPARFREWVGREYRADDALAGYEPPRPGPRARR